MPAVNTSASSPAQRDGQLADLLRGAVGVEVHRQHGARLVAGQQHAHVAADAGNPLEAPTGPYSMAWIASASMPCAASHSTAPGSMLPQRVPIGMPSSAVSPIVDSTLRPSRIAQRLAPLPRCATMTRPSREIRRHLPQPARDIRIRQPVKAVTADAALVVLARQRHQLRRAGSGRRGRRCRSRPPAAAPARPRAPRGSRVRLCGWCSGASRHEGLQPLDHVVVDRHRVGEVRAAVHHAMADRHRRRHRAGPRSASAESGGRRRRGRPPAPRETARRPRRGRRPCARSGAAPRRCPRSARARPVRAGYRHCGAPTRAPRRWKPSRSMTRR